MSLGTRTHTLNQVPVVLHPQVAHVLGQGPTGTKSTWDPPLLGPGLKGLGPALTGPKSTWVKVPQKSTLDQVLVPDPTGPKSTWDHVP
jgi:hypothetical protein